jgi:signal transduction histidine kinase
MEAIARIEAEYGRYVFIKDQVILHYKEGDRETGTRLHKETRNRFFKILDLCEKYKALRNPLTSVKMRLFSLHRALELSPIQRDDFEVISEEIRHIDTIVQNFLEFSRPPKLKTQKISPSEIVDLVFELLRHRLESYNVAATVSRQAALPDIQVDPEQLKEVLINILENACEAGEEA